MNENSCCMNVMISGTVGYSRPEVFQDPDQVYGLKTLVLERESELAKERERVRRLRDALKCVRRKYHYACEDNWYSCPKSEDGCSDKGKGDDCDCGMDRVNKIIDEALAETEEKP